MNLAVFNISCSTSFSHDFQQNGLDSVGGCYANVYWTGSPIIKMTMMMMTMMTMMTMMMTMMTMMTMMMTMMTMMMMTMMMMNSGVQLFPTSKSCHCYRENVKQHSEL